MTLLSWLVLGFSGFFAAVHLVLGAQFVRRFTHGIADRTPDAECHPALVVLCIRGADPFLERCLTALFRQDYPAYEVRIIVDTQEDPGWALVQRLIGDLSASHVSVSPLLNRRPSCSLKCSAQLQALQDLKPQHQILAFLDADTVPHATWLRELAGALRDPTIGAATGGRWYMPASPSAGSIVRLLWNMPAQVVMTVVNIAWGGTLAFRRQTFDELKLCERWGGALCEDTMTADVLKQHGLRMRFVPSLLMVNREDCGFVRVSFWIARQLINTRLYHSTWWFVIGHGSLVFTTVYGGLALAALAAYLQDSMAMWRCLGAVALFQATMLAQFLWLQISVSRTIARRGEEPSWGSWKAWLTVPFMIFVAQAVHFWALLWAQSAKTVEWRGIIYRVKSPFKIQVIGESKISTVSTHSL